MSNILKFINKKNTIFLTYSPAKDEYERICGHTFEVMDYYLFLKDQGYQCKIIILDKFKNKEKIFNAWEDKYYINFDYKKDIEFKNINLNKKNKLFFPGDIIITSGIDLMWSQSIELYCKNIISFQCEEFDFKDYLNKKNFYLLRDERIYKIKNHSERTFNYIKKIYFKRYKKLKSIKDNKTLIYINSKLRDLDENNIKQYIQNFNLNNILFISGTILDKTQEQKYLKYGKLEFAPVKNLFEKFNTFLVLPNTRNFDCSPRFITECAFYDKNIIITFDLKTDKGLYWRWYDIQNNFESLILK